MKFYHCIYIPSSYRIRRRCWYRHSQGNVGPYKVVGNWGGAEKGNVVVVVPAAFFACQRREKERNDRIVIEFVLTGVTSALELERIQLDTVTPFLRHSRRSFFRFYFFDIFFLFPLDSNGRRRFLVVIPPPSPLCVSFFLSFFSHLPFQGRMKEKQKGKKRG